MYHAVQCDGWRLLIIFTEEENNSATLVLEGEGVPPVHSLTQKVTSSCNPCFFKQLYFVDSERWEELMKLKDCLTSQEENFISLANISAEIISVFFIGQP